MKIANHIRKVRTEVWASPRPGLDLDGLVASLESTGTEILNIDRENQRILVGFEEQVFEETDDGVTDN